METAHQFEDLGLEGSGLPVEVEGFYVIVSPALMKRCGPTAKVRLQ